MNTLDTILTLAAMIAVPFSSIAQFHTITKDCPIVGHNLVKTDKVIEKEIITNIKPLQECHWTQSVKAYYTKVQYRYKGGNYLLWLKNIGYAEDPGYIRAVIRVLRQI